MIIINLILIFTILLQLVQITFDIKVNRYIYIFNLAQLIIIAITLYQNSYQWQLYPFSALYILCILVYRKGSHRSLITNKVGKNILNRNLLGNILVVDINILLFPSSLYAKNHWILSRRNNYLHN